MNNSSTDARAYTIRAVDRAVDVLLAFSYDAPARTLTEIAQITHLPTPTALRVLSSLRSRGFIEQDESNGKYTLGFELIGLGEIRKHTARVWGPAKKYLRQVRDETDETVMLCVRHNDERLILDQVEGTRPIRLVAKVGERIPLYVGAASKALLAGMGDAEIDQYLRRTELKALGPATIANPRSLRAEIATVCAQGYALGSDELNAGGNGIAVQVRDFSGRVVGALQVSMSSERWNEDVRAQVLAALQKAAAGLSTQLGFRAAILSPSTRDSVIAGVDQKVAEV